MTDQMLRCEHGFCGYEIEWRTASKPENADLRQLHGCPESAGTLRAVLTDAQRLTMLTHMLKATVVPYGDSYVTTWDRWVDFQVPMVDMLREVAPLAAPPYSPDEFDLMMAVLRGAVSA